MVLPVARSIIRVSSRQRLMGSTDAPGITSTTVLSRAAAYSTNQNTTSKNTQSRKDALSQGNINDPSNLHKKDTYAQSAKGGKEARKQGEKGSLDAAANENVQQGSGTIKNTKGNPEGIGMKDQVGSASGTESTFGKK